jgi:outer membrane protein assembly factor BamD
MILPFLLFFGCASKDKYNKSDDFWYKDIIKGIEIGDMDRADDSFISLESEHIHSPLLETASLLMIQAHIKNENYLLAGHYMDRYNQLFGTKESKEYIEYLRIKSKYLGFKRVRRDQKLILDTLQLAENYLFEFPSSQYIPYIETMKTNLTLAKYELNFEIMALYKKLGKDKAVEFYKNSEDMSWFKSDEVQKPNISFLRAIFE